MGSSRLPGKSMMDLAGAPLVSRILERVKRCQKVDEIVLAIPDTEKDKVLIEIGNQHGIKVFAGSEDDLVDRYFEAAKKYMADIVGRLPADNATPEPKEIDRIVEHHISLGRRGFSSNLTEIAGSGYPDGIGAEVFDFTLLSEIQKQKQTASQREHVHLNFYDYSTKQAVDSQWCPVSTVSCPADFRRPDLILDVNTQVQYEFMKKLYEYLYPRNPNFHISDIIKWYDDIYQRDTAPKS